MAPRSGAWSSYPQAGYDLPLRTVRPENHFLALPSPYQDADAEAQRAQTRGASLQDSLDAYSEELAGTDDAAATRGHPVLLDMELGFYARCEPERGRTRVGRVDYDGDRALADPDELDEEVSDATRAWARETLGERMPVYKKEPDAGSLAAWYTLTPDAEPLIGPLPGASGLYCVTGFSGHGFKLAPAVAEGVAQMIFGQPVTAFDTELFSPLRFGSRAESAWTGAFGL